MNNLAINQAPFVIEHGQVDVASGGYFTPVARLIVQPTLPTSGFLAALPDREAKSLLLLLTFLTPNGRIEPTTSQLASALHVPEWAVRSRMGRLCAFRWQGERVVRHNFCETGLDSYRLSPNMVGVRLASEQKEVLAAAELSSDNSSGETTGTAGLMPVAGSRDAVIAFSRDVYGRPREEVERNIERQLGNIEGCKWRSAAEPSDVPEVRRRLLNIGVAASQADRLLVGYPLGEVREQLDWLPDRSARSPARYVVSAIEGHYGPPPRVRLERAIAEEQQEDHTPAPPAEPGQTTVTATTPSATANQTELPEQLPLHDAEFAVGPTSKAACIIIPVKPTKPSVGAEDAW